MGMLTESVTLLDESQKNVAKGRLRRVLKDACAAGYADIVDLLIKASADTNDFGGPAVHTHRSLQPRERSRPSRSDTPRSRCRSRYFRQLLQCLFCCLESGHDDVVLWLLAAGADCDQLASRTSALQVAAEGGHDQCVRWLIAAGADLDQQAEGTALYRAARKGYLGIIQPTPCRGADVDSQEEHGENAKKLLSRSSSFGRTDEVRGGLLNAGADVERLRWDQRNSNSSSCCEAECAPVVKLLLDKLKPASKQGMRILLPASSKPAPTSTSISASTEKKPSRRYMRLDEGPLAIMRQLLDAGATVDGKAGYLGTPLLAAVSEGHVEVMTLLLDAGADLQARSAVNIPALVVALDKGHPEVVENLINAGANVNDSAEYYGSALQAAAFKGYRDVAEKLLDVGADPAMEGGRYGLAIFAAAAKQRGVVKMFIDRRVVTKEQAKKAKDRVEED
ncbi:hypothetical protein ACKAV7_008172 [Fusarium commune]